MTRPLPPLLLLAVLVTGCAGDPGAEEDTGTATGAGEAATRSAPASTSAPAPAPPPTSGATATTDPGAAAPEPDPGAVAAAAALAPAGAERVTVTDWAALKDRLGAGELTSESLQTDRIEFWRGVGSSAVLFTDGALREENSRLGLRYGTTQDDVRWEVRWSDGAEDGAGAGLLLRLRDDLDLSGLTRAVEDDVAGLGDATVEAADHLLVRGVDDRPPLATDTALVAALSGAGESALAASGCLPWTTALGVDATADELTEVSAVGHEDLLDPQSWAATATGRQVRLRVVHPPGTDPHAAGADAATRLELAEAWPTTEGAGWRDAFGLPPDLSGPGYTVSEESGHTVATLEYRAVSTTAAAGVLLADLVPGAVCADPDVLEEPTGL